ncbi:MAG: HEAT repeat domain-containing protein [Terriglobales bacterium]
METPPNAPTPDYGTLGPGSDIKLDKGGDVNFDKAAEVKLSPQPDAKGRVASIFKLGFPTGSPRTSTPSGVPQTVVPAIRVVAVLAGVMMAFAFFLARQVITKTHRAENELQATNGSRRSASNTRRSAPHYDSAAQHDAEQLLQRAIRNDAAATSQVGSRAAAWRGRIQLTPQLTSLITAGLNAGDLRVRAATIRVDLAAMNIAEDASSLDRLAAQAESTDHATRIWALWTLGLVANRGIQTDRITAVLTAHLYDTDVESRHWAVEALSYVGTDAVIPPLLKAMHDDPSPLVRECAACGLAQSGMLTSEQRHSAIPTLIAYADDPALDAATHAWTYHALRDITAQNLPDDSAAWRKWYEGGR